MAAEKAFLIPKSPFVDPWNWFTVSAQALETQNGKEKTQKLLDTQVFIFRVLFGVRLFCPLTTNLNLSFRITVILGRKVICAVPRRKLSGPSAIPAF